MSTSSFKQKCRFKKKINPTSASTDSSHGINKMNDSYFDFRSRPAGSGRKQTVGEKSLSNQAVLPRVEPLEITKPLKSKPKSVATILSPNNYKVRPIIPAKKKELISVAKAMHREEFSHRVHKLFKPETDAALEAMETSVYIGWRCPEYSWDCIRLSKHSRCFCDHNLSEHAAYTGRSKRVKCLHVNCVCEAFAFIPERPEDIGEWWLPKRPGFEPHLWRAKCRCKHTHDHHNPRSRKCTVRSCSCFRFESAFLCAACDKHWEEHETFFDTSETRKKKGLPYATSNLPFYELPDLRNICLSGSGMNDNVYRQLSQGPYDIPGYNPTPLTRQLSRK